MPILSKQKEAEVARMPLKKFVEETIAPLNMCEHCELESYKIRDHVGRVQQYSCSKSGDILTGKCSRQDQAECCIAAGGHKGLCANELIPFLLADSKNE